QQALAIDRAEASKLISVAKAVPSDLILAIGKAPKIGRGRWQVFAEALQDKSALKRAQAAATLPAFARASGDERFARALNAAKRHETQKPSDRSIIEIKDATGRAFAEIRASERDVKVTMAKQTGSAFVQFLTLRLPELFEEFRTFEAADGVSKGS